VKRCFPPRTYNDALEAIVLRVGLVAILKIPS